MTAIENSPAGRARILLRGAALAALALAATPCLAQATAGSEKAAADTGKTVDEIVVTGSSIRGVAPTGVDTPAYAAFIGPFVVRQLGAIKRHLTPVVLRPPLHGDDALEAIIDGSTSTARRP